ncbi:angiopoietin-related protein 4-like [Liolophura sinensis]|uniref:angiopoietin-related protein 4-like n=1 Tax=Liolophura sinensis TaxID=3198878 RepID=UPI00315849F6
MVFASGFWTLKPSSDQFQLTSIGSCLTEIRLSIYTLKPEVAISASHCALTCESHNGCSQFLYCEHSGKNCFPIRALGVLDSDRRKYCFCYVKLNPKCENGGEWKSDKCECIPGFHGNRCEFIAGGCSQAMSHGNHRNGAYLVKPKHAIGTFPVLCEKVGSNFYTFIQRRVSGKTNFDLSWKSYNKGFGSVKWNFWLGFDQILSLMENQTVELEIGLTCDLDTKGSFTLETFQLDDFSLAGEDHQYQIQLPNQGTTQGSQSEEEIHNSLLSLAGQPFSTYDHDSSSPNCRNTTSGGWWFGTQCAFGNLNAPFTDYGLDANNKSILWITWRSAGFEINIKETYMKIKT